MPCSVCHRDLALKVTARITLAGHAAFANAARDSTKMLLPFCYAYPLAFDPLLPCAAGSLMVNRAYYCCDTSTMETV